VIWENHSETQGTWYSTTFSRSYKDGEGNWKSAQSFGRDDLLAVGKVAEMAVFWINKQLGGGWRKMGAGPAEQQGTDTTTPVSDADIPF
jgi:hypothetical protein